MLKKLQIASVALIVCLAMPNVANANYSQWKKMSFEWRAGYAIGLYDMAKNSYEGEFTSNAVAEGLDVCLEKLKLTPEMIVEAITKYYQDNVDMWGEPPSVAFRSKIVMGACLLHVNQSRAKYGLQPWPKD